MSGSSSSRSGSPTAVGGAGRWLLLGAVLIGLLAMHFLSGRDSAGHHRVLAPSSVTAAGAAADAPMAAVMTSVDEATGDGHAITTGAVLLLAAAVIALAGAIQRRRIERRPLTAWAVRADGRRGPPTSMSRRALCVERI